MRTGFADMQKGERMSDQIDRQATIDALCERCRQDNPDTNACDICDDMEILKNIPSAQQERKKGYWIILGGNDHKCSVCKYVFHNYLEEQNFCPNCGCDMRGDGDGSD